MLKITESRTSNVLRLSPGQKVSRKYRKQSIRRKQWKRECGNLKAIIPSVANKKVSEVTVIEEAIGYIEHLHTAIAARLGIKPEPQKECPKEMPDGKPVYPNQSIHLPFVDEAFVELLRTQGTQHLWGLSDSPSIYQKRIV